MVSSWFSFDLVSKFRDWHTTAEAHSSLSSILFRLNAGFVSVIERFTKGRSTSTDYQALQNLSNASRMEAIHTFEQLANRLSRSSLTLLPANKQHERLRHERKSSKNSSSAVGHVRHARSKSAPELAVTPLGYANSEGWVRSKPGRKRTSDSSRHRGTSTRKRSSVRRQPQNSPRQANPASIPRSEPSPALPLIKAPPPPPPPRARTENRKSIMSFASDSTKLGEIPEHRWNRPAMFGTADGNFPVTAFYPLEPHQEPEKPRSRLMRLFRR